MSDQKPRVVYSTPQTFGKSYDSLMKMVEAAGLNGTIYIEPVLELKQLRADLDVAIEAMQGAKANIGIHHNHSGQTVHTSAAKRILDQAVAKLQEEK